MGGALGLDGTALSRVAAPYLAPVMASQGIGRRFPRIIQPICGSKSTDQMAICFSRKTQIMQVLGSASGTWGGNTRVDLLDVEGTTLLTSA